MHSSDRANHILTRAREFGFIAAGVTAVTPMDPTPLRDWLDAGYGAEMDYLRRHLPLRADLAAVLPGARSAISLALPYPTANPDEPLAPLLARYARGRDYHDVLHELLEQLWAEIRAEYPDAQARIFVDSGPLPERELARRAGLGWVGSHSCLINPEIGTRFVLGEILTTLELAPTAPIEGTCGSCRRCLDACPTGALVARGVVDARRCLSYLTIEHKGAIPRELRPLIGTRLFGCDACQDACPYNGKLGEPEIPESTLVSNLCALLSITLAEFSQRFRGTAIMRAKRRGLLRNACIVLGNLGDPAAIPTLTQALPDPDPLIRTHAAWALGRLGQDDALRFELETVDNPTVREEMNAALNMIS